MAVAVAVAVATITGEIGKAHVDSLLTGVFLLLLQGLLEERRTGRTLWSGAVAMVL